MVFLFFLSFFRFLFLLSRVSAFLHLISINDFPSLPLFKDIIVVYPSSFANSIFLLKKILHQCRPPPSSSFSPQAFSANPLLPFYLTLPFLPSLNTFFSHHLYPSPPSLFACLPLALSSSPSPCPSSPTPIPTPPCRTASSPSSPHHRITFVFPVSYQRDEAQGLPSRYSQCPISCLLSIVSLPLAHPHSKK